MKNYGIQNSTVRPLEVEITETKVFVSTNIKEVTKNHGEDVSKEFEFNLVEYDKDEYITLQSEKNNSLESQITDAQMALVEIYEMTLV